MESVGIAADPDFNKTSADKWVIRGGRSTGPEETDTTGAEVYISDTAMHGRPAERGGRTRDQCKTRIPRPDKGWEPAERVIGEVRARRGGIPARNRGKDEWSKVTREELEEMNKADEATRSAEDVERDSGRGEQRKCKKAITESMKEEKWSHCEL